MTSRNREVILQLWLDIMDGKRARGFLDSGKRLWYDEKNKRKAEKNETR